MVRAAAGKDDVTEGAGTCKEANSNLKDCLVGALRARVDFLQNALETSKVVEVKVPMETELAAQLDAQVKTSEELKQSLTQAEKRCSELAQALEQKSLAFEELSKEHAELKAMVRKRLRLDAIAHWWPSDTEASEEERAFAEQRARKKASLHARLSEKSRLDSSTKPEDGGGGTSPSQTRSPLSLDLSPFADAQSSPAQRHRGRYDYCNSYCAAIFEDTHRSVSSDAEAAVEEPEAAQGADPHSRMSFFSKKAVAERARLSLATGDLDQQEDEQVEATPEEVLRSTFPPLTPGGRHVLPRSPSRRNPGHAKFSEGEVFPPPTVAASQGYAAEWLEAAEVWLGCAEEDVPELEDAPELSELGVNARSGGDYVDDGNGDLERSGGAGGDSTTQADEPAKAAAEPEESTASERRNSQGFYRRKCEDLTLAVNDLSAQYQSMCPLRGTIERARRSSSFRLGADEDE